MTEMTQHLKGLIRAQGPISIAEFMRTVLTDRGDSYYRRADPFGASGDFVTAPEVSQIFGELIGLWCVDVWHKLGSPARFTLAELGPGRGTLMKDALRAAGVVPAFVDAASVVLVEVSEVLRSVQRETLVGSAVRWHDRFEEIDADGPIIVIANEFFDALPVRQFVHTQGAWAERCLGLNAEGDLVFGLAPGRVDMKSIAARLPDVVDGAVIEVSPARTSVARAIGERLVRFGGAALVVDYGFAGPAAGDTLQAVKAHAYADVLAEPGEADLTSHVDFTALAEAFAEGGAVACGPTTQGEFLTRLGASARVEKLKQSASAAQADQVEAGYRRLTSPKAMGSLFKVLCAVWPASIQPAGFSGT